MTKPRFFSTKVEMLTFLEQTWTTQAELKVLAKLLGVSTAEEVKPALDKLLKRVEAASKELETLKVEAEARGIK